MYLETVPQHVVPAVDQAGLPVLSIALMSDIEPLTKVNGSHLLLWRPARPLSA
jgi:hypothetical protein